MARTLLAPAFGVAMAVAFALGWLALDRAFTDRARFAILAIAAGAALAAAIALLVMQVLAGRPWSARFAAALLLLLSGTAVLTSLLLAIPMAWLAHPFAELPIHHVLIIVALTGAGTLYNFLAVAAFLILPLGAPLIVLFALLMAKRSR